MRYSILGPLVVTDEGRNIGITAHRDRVMLAMLLLHPYRIVGVDELIDAIWEDSPPATARGQLQICVSRLRRSLPADSIKTDPSGYGISLAPGQLDAIEFTRLTDEAKGAGEPDRARRLYREALARWRGPALSGLESRAIRQGAAPLDELRAVAIEDWAELELAAGGDRDLLAELAGLVEQFPLRERLRVHLIVALYRAGRRADALAEFRRARDVLRDELGIDPGPALSDLHSRILLGDLDSPVTAVASRGLPRTVGDFTGRAATVQRLVDEIAGADPATPLIKVIDGMAGSGKTTLALHVAHTVADRFPDGQLFVDLHGSSDREPAEPAAALGLLLRQLGVPAGSVPADLEGRAALWRGELAGRRVLVVLDNAAGTAQIGPLLPAAPGTTALVTSRRRLAGLDGVRPESIPLLTEAEGVELLARIAGDRVRAEPEAAADVVRRCGRLPLAIRLAGSRLAHRQRWRVADLVRRLGEQGAALPELIAEDRTVRSAFAVSYGQLEASDQRGFRLLGLNPAATFDVLAVAALTDRTIEGSEDLLDHLVDMHLVEEPEPGVFWLHDLMREYAATLAAQEPDEAREHAISGLLDFHVHAAARAAAAIDEIAPGSDLTLDKPLRPDLLDAVPEDWFESARGALPGLADAAIAAGRPEFSWLLAWASWVVLFQRGHIDEILQLGRRAEAAARAAGDKRALAVVLNGLASAHYRTANYPEALERLRESTNLRRELGDRAGEAALLGNLSTLHESVGELREAVDSSARGLALRRRMRDDRGIIKRLMGLAVPMMKLGEHDGAERHLRLALQLSAESRDALSVAMTLSRLGEIRIAGGRAASAAPFFAAARTAAERAGYALGRAEVLTGLGRIAHVHGDYGEAVDLHERALKVCTELGDPRSRSLALNDLGAALAAAGRDAEALARFREARQVAAAVHHRYEEARALSGLAGLLETGEPATALRCWQQALVLFARMGVPVDDDVKRRVGELRAQ